MKGRHTCNQLGRAIGKLQLQNRCAQPFDKHSQNNPPNHQFPCLCVCGFIGKRAADGLVAHSPRRALCTHLTADGHGQRLVWPPTGRNAAGWAPPHSELHRSRPKNPCAPSSQSQPPPSCTTTRPDAVHGQTAQPQPLAACWHHLRYQALPATPTPTTSARSPAALSTASSTPCACGSRLPGSGAVTAPCQRTAFDAPPHPHVLWYGM